MPKFRKIRGKRGATSVSILLLAVMALILSSVALFVFLYQNGKMSKAISDVRFVEETYGTEELFKFYMMHGLTSEEAASLAGDVTVTGEKAEIRKNIKTDETEMLVMYQFDIK